MPHPGVVEPGDQLQREVAFGTRFEHRAHGGDVIAVEPRSDADAPGTRIHRVVELVLPAGVARVERHARAEQRVVCAGGEHGLIAGAGVEAEQ